MIAIALICAFESSFFPRSVFLEHFHNPAFLGRERCEIMVGTGTSFGLSELRHYDLQGVVGPYHVSMYSFGDDVYRENIISGGGSVAFGSTRVGFSVGLLNQYVRDHYNRVCYSLRLGGIWSCNPAEVGLWIHNVNVPRFSTLDHVPIIYSLRFVYRPVSRSAVMCSVRGRETSLPFYNVGVSYEPVQYLMLGAAVNTEPLYLEYIMQLSIGSFALSYAGSNHRHLGLSHSFILGFRL